MDKERLNKVESVFAILASIAIIAGTILAFQKGCERDTPRSTPEDHSERSAPRPPSPIQATPESPQNPPQEQGAPTGAGVGESARQEVDDLTFELTSCYFGGSSLTCDFLVTSTVTERQVTIYTGSQFSRMVDDLGYEHLSRVHSPDVKLAVGVPMRFQIVFERISPEAKAAKLIELVAGNTPRSGLVGGVGKFKVPFHEIHLSRR